ncbi:cleavage and polyadenylation specificity factor subunit 6 isoform X2 [Nematostella vectensis]|uniref:cleavage and polyadenylation specificity factor subunit 6 isoform X2 n=1 Tax=Nematostella vectensis TaxID=45351 RepID=UPI001390185C|nr:cleavage and polyadenylation specificity factor subunit 6 isoform X2 [Nematostella vectensis]
MATDAADIDLYAGVDELDHEMNHHEQPSDDLYDDTLTTSAEQQAEDEALQGIVSYSGDLVQPPTEASSGPGSNYEYKSYTTVHPKSAASLAAQSSYERPRGKPLYVGNLTWWTTDQQLTEALQECGVTDLINIKFFDNRTNGQSKGFAMIELGSDKSIEMVTERLPKFDIEGQNPVVTPATKQHLHEFEAQHRAKAPGTAFQGGGDPYQGVPGGPGFGPPGFDRGRGFRGGFRGRGAPRPGMGRGFEHGEMGRGGPWMGPGGPMGPRQPPPGMMPPYGGHPPQGYGMAPDMTGYGQMDKPPAIMPPVSMPPMHHPGMAYGGAPPMPHPVVAPHVNPAFFPEGAPPDFAGAARMDHALLAQYQARPGDDYAESMKRNQALASTAIKRAMSDANAGDYESGIETLVTAVSLIKQSVSANEESCLVLVQSLQSCLQGLESQLLERSHRKDRDDDDRERRHRRRRSRSRSRDRRSRSRERRSRSRERHRSRRERSERSRE